MTPLIIKAQGTSDHAGINFGHAGPFSSPDGTGLVQEDPDIRIFYLKVLNYPSKYHLAFYLSVLNVVKCHCFSFVDNICSTIEGISVLF